MKGFILTKFPPSETSLSEKEKKKWARTKQGTDSEWTREIAERTMEDLNGNMPPLRDASNLMQPNNVSSIQASTVTTCVIPPSERVAPVLQLTTQLIHTYTTINHVG